MVNPASNPDTIESLHGVRLSAVRSGLPEEHTAPLAATIRTAEIPRDPTAQPLWVREDSGERYTSRVELYPHTDGWLLNIDCEGRGRFLVHRDGIDIDWDGGTPPDHYLQTLGLSLWLELRGVLCLHANTLTRNESAIGFIAPSQTGKTTLTAAFAEAGWSMLTDDMAAIYPGDGSYGVYPSRPEARLWPDAGRHFRGDNYDDCPPVHARFAKRVVPMRGTGMATGMDVERPQALQRLYLLERSTDTDAPIAFETVGPADALVALMQNSILGDAVGCLGIEAERLRRIAGLLAAVPVVRVSYPHGLGQIDRVRQAIEKDLQNT